MWSEASLAVVGFWEADDVMSFGEPMCWWALRAVAVCFYRANVVPNNEFRQVRYLGLLKNLKLILSADKTKSLNMNIFWIF